MSRTVSIKQAAEITGRSVNTISSWVNRGTLPRHGNGVSLDDVLTVHKRRPTRSRAKTSKCAPGPQTQATRTITLKDGTKIEGDLSDALILQMIQGGE